MTRRETHTECYKKGSILGGGGQAAVPYVIALDPIQSLFSQLVESFVADTKAVF